MPLPNFLIVGANKAGTTSLYRYLGQHPDVFVSPVKEPSYFTKVGTEPPAEDELGAIERRTQETVTRTLDAYLALFEGARDEQARGEASTAYLSNPLAPARIHDAIPDVRLIAVLRNPIDQRVLRVRDARAVGCRDPILRRHGRDRARWRSPSELRTHYVATGRYGEQLGRYLARFDRDQLRVYLYEDFGADPHGVLREVCGFLGVDDAFTPDLTVRRNVTRAPSRLDRLPAPLRRARALVPASLRSRLRTRTAVANEMTDETRSRLVAHYRDDVLEAARLVDRDLSSWITPD